VSDVRGSVEQALAEWRAAERALAGAADDVSGHGMLQDECERLRVRYQHIVLAARGQIDQLEGAAEDSWDRLDSSRQRVELARRCPRPAPGDRGLGEPRNVR
jgi:hypothetical protein